MSFKVGCLFYWQVLQSTPTASHSNLCELFQVAKVTLVKELPETFPVKSFVVKGSLVDEETSVTGKLFYDYIVLFDAFRLLQLSYFSLKMKSACRLVIDNIEQFSMFIQLTLYSLSRWQNKWWWKFFIAGVPFDEARVPQMS